MGKRLKPARNKDGRSPKGAAPPFQEWGVVHKKDKGLIHAALVYPNTYKAGMSSLGFQTVYRLANQIDTVSCERVFLPDPEKGRRQSANPRSIESGLSLNRFDILLFSISFENDFDHLVQLLGEAGIPLRSPDRNHTHPLVVAGGVACFLNPEPIAPFIDLFLLGEAEKLLAPFFRLFSPARDRARLFEDLEQKIPGAYVPIRHVGHEPFKIKVQYIEHLDNVTTASSLLTRETAFKNTFLIETLKGCPHGCRFCSAGFIYRPPRIYPTRNICQAIDTAVDVTHKIGLVSSAVADHPDIIEICDYGLSKGLKLSFSSLRADKLSDPLIEVLSASKVKTATIAPEAGSDRMRRVINKKIDEIDILSAASRLVQAGIINLRLYFMVGLPFETDNDAQAIVDLTQKIKMVFLEESRKQKKIGTITLSINPFIPKPATPFQWSAMERDRVLKNRIKIIRQGLAATANVTLQVESLRKAKVHALLSRGDQKIADLIEAAQISGWTAVMNQHQSLCDEILYTQRPLDAPLPWDFLDNRVNKAFLKKEFQRAGQEKNSPSCAMADCRQCRTCI